jgi:hypothetical protein
MEPTPFLERFPCNRLTAHARSNSYHSALELGRQGHHKYLNFSGLDPYSGYMPDREDAFCTVRTLSVDEVAREMGVAPSFVVRQCQTGELPQQLNGLISGKEFSRYLRRHREETKEKLGGVL